MKSLKIDNKPLKYVDSKIKTAYDKLEIPIQTIPRNYFSDEQLVSYVNLPESYASLIDRLIDLTYAGSFMLNSPRASFTIDYSEIAQAVNILGIDKSLSIISFGVTIPDESVKKVSSIYFVKGQNAEIIVIPCEEVPYMTLPIPPVEIRISEYKKRESDMKVEGTVCYKYNQPQSIHYVKLRVVFRDYQGIPSQLSKLQHISNYF